MRKPQSGLIDEKKLAIVTDLYQLTMARGYFENEKQNEIATFDLFFRSLPEHRSYMVVAGLEPALHYLTTLQFAEDSIELLKNHSSFKDAPEGFWEYLRNFKFTGDVWAMPEGELAYGNEPMITVKAPIIEAQLAETFLLCCYNHQTKIASKAARVVEAAKGSAVLDFGMRRTDIGAAARGARAAYLGGMVATSNVIAEDLFGIPSRGTHAHSWVMSFDSEFEAFAAYYKVFGKETVALIDTYDTIEGAVKAAQLPGPIKGVRLDSGALGNLSKDVRKTLDALGKSEVKIAASNDLNEYKIEKLLNEGAKIDLWGVGTEMILSRDDPTLGGVYKLAEIIRDGVHIPKLKLSKNKSTLPGVKQVYRITDENGLCERDIIALRDEEIEGAKPLLVPVMKNGELIYDLPELSESREYALANIAKLPTRYRQTKADHGYEVGVSEELSKLREEIAAQYSAGESNTIQINHAPARAQAEV